MRKPSPRPGMTTTAFAYFLGKRYEKEKNGHGGERASGNAYHLRTCERLAEQNGVSEKTVRNAATLARAIDRLAHAEPSLKSKLLAEALPLSRRNILQLASLEKPPVNKLLEGKTLAEIRRMYPDQFVPERNCPKRNRTRPLSNAARSQWFPTPCQVTEALLSAVSFKGTIWECACGRGEMSRVLEAHGFKVISSDIADYGYGEAGVDFLHTVRKVDNIITNPPWKDSTAFARHALRCVRRKVAMLLPLSFLAGLKRRSFFQEGGLRWVLVLSRRVQFIHGKKADLDVAWFVWQKGWHGKPQLGWL